MNGCELERLQKRENISLQSDASCRSGEEEVSFSSECFMSVLKKCWS